MFLFLWVAVCCLRVLYAWKSCLSCSDVVDPTDCAIIERCGPHEDCYTNMYVNSVGGIRYSLGCRDTQLCSSSYSPNSGSLLVCAECCPGELCNSAGCRGKGYPTPRGPICTNCQQQAYVDDCDHITMCAHGEVCMLKKTLSPMTHAVRYQTKCQSEAICHTEMNQFKQTAAIITGKREAQTTLHVGGQCIMKCCQTDMCNDNCNDTTSSGPSVLSTHHRTLTLD